MFMLKLSHQLCFKNCPYQQYDVCSVQCWCTVHWTLQHRLRLSSTEDARPMPPPLCLSLDTSHMNSKILAVKM